MIIRKNNKFVIQRTNSSPTSFMASLESKKVLILINKKDDVIKAMQWVYEEMTKRECFRGLFNGQD